MSSKNKQSGEAVFAKREIVDVPVTVRMEHPAPEVAKYMKVPNSGEVLAVREPTAAEGGYVHYLTPKTSNNPHMSDREATILALARRHHLPAREVLKKLSEGGEPMELGKGETLPFLKGYTGPFTKVVEIPNNSPEAKKLKEEIKKVNDEVRKAKLEEQANRFKQSKRFRKKLNQGQSST